MGITKRRNDLNRPLIASLLVAASLTTVFMTPALAAGHASVRQATCSTTIQGQGSSFDAPLFSADFAKYSSSHPSICVNYQATGSGQGQATLNAKTTDFGSFDVPMGIKGDSFNNLSNIMQFPVTLGGEAITYNLPSSAVGHGLKLTGALLGKIYLGKITKWTNSGLEKLNPKLKTLKGGPYEKIVVVHRSDSSGTTYAFTNFLSKTSPAWKSTIGATKLPAWPVGLGGSHSAGVDAYVNANKGAIGYVEHDYAVQNHREPAFVENRAKKFLRPANAYVLADASGFKKISPRPGHFSIVYGPGAKAYPISTYSWTGVYTKGSNWASGKTICGHTVALFKWETSTAQKFSAANQYVPLPKRIQVFATSQLKKVKCGS